MFERFTERARRVVVFAQVEARALKHNYIGTEHLLLGLLREDEGLAARALGSLEITVEEVRAQVARIVGEGDELATGQIPFTPRAKKVLELSLREALALGHNYIGTEHLLLGLLREGQGVAATVLRDLGADASKLQDELIRMLSGPARSRAQIGPPVIPSPESPLDEYLPESPAVSPAVSEELLRVRREKDKAIEENDFERAAMLRERERRLSMAARQLATAWDAPLEDPVTESFVELPSRRTMSLVGSEELGPTPFRQALFLGWGLFGAALALGILLGWLIWG